MKFEETIQYFFDNYALVYRERWQVLDQLFCVIGGGYKWENGELIEEDMKNYKVKLEPDGKAKMKKKVLEKLYKENFDSVVERIENDRKEMVKEGYTEEEACEENPLEKEVLWRRTIEFTDRIANREKKLFPLSPSTSNIFRVPEDIRPDWVEGVKEVIELILETEDFTDTSDKNEWQIEQMLLAKKQLDELIERL